MHKILTIAGSDSGGGAGIQADLKVFAAHGIYGMSAITALTAQNTLGVQGIFNVSPAFVAQQIDSVMSDIGADAWKTGMLANAEIISVVAERARYYGIQRLVVDPVMVAKGGDPLLDPNARDTLIARLLPLASIVTPNRYEAQVLTGIEIRTVDDARQAAAVIHQLGARSVLVKGGHLPSTEAAIDVFYDGCTWSEISAPRLATRNTHGTGCTLASAITVALVQEHTLKAAVQQAKAYLTAALRLADALHIGHGHGPLNHCLGQSILVPEEAQNA